jgi:hypothetical protein
MQAVAWAGMLATRSADKGIVAAAASTFSGDEPCALCTAVKNLRAQDEAPLSPKPQAPDKDPLAKTVKKSEAILAESPDFVATLSSIIRWDIAAHAAPPDSILDIDPPPPRC